MMIGHSGAGKTTYIAAMYAVMQSGINGFSIKADKKDLHEQLKLLSDNLQKGYYPNSTDIHSVYKFNLRYNSEDVLPFTWYDYRGGALLQSKRESDEVKDLDKKIRDSNALIVFLDGEKIMRNDYDVQKEYRRTQLFIQRAISNLSDDSIMPISLVITKADTPGMDLNKSPMIRHIERTWEAMTQNEKVVGILSSTVINQNEIVNVHFPFLNSMCFGLKRERDKIEGEINKHVTKGDSLNESANIFDSIWSAIVGEESYKELADKEYNKAKRKIAVYDQLIDRTNRIIDIMQDAVNNGFIFIT